jgi:hypothetical protein
VEKAAPSLRGHIVDIAFRFQEAADLTNAVDVAFRFQEAADLTTLLM